MNSLRSFMYTPAKGMLGDREQHTGHKAPTIHRTIALLTEELLKVVLSPSIDRIMQRKSFRGHGDATSLYTAEISDLLALCGNASPLKQRQHRGNNP